MNPHQSHTEQSDRGSEDKNVVNGSEVQTVKRADESIGRDNNATTGSNFSKVLRKGIISKNAKTQKVSPPVSKVNNRLKIKVEGDDPDQELRTRHAEMRFSSEKASLLSNVLHRDPSMEGIDMVKRLVNRRRVKNEERDYRIRKNRGLGSTKTTYSTNYRDYATQSLANLTKVYTSGDRSASQRKLTASEFNIKLPAIEYVDPNRPKAIEYFSQRDQNQMFGGHVRDSIQSSYDPPAGGSNNYYTKNKFNKINKDSIFESTQDGREAGGDHSSYKPRGTTEAQEMTTGWQFATQIEDDNDDQAGERNYEVVDDIREHQNKSALLIANREVFPSMLDPAFEDEDAPSPGIKVHDMMNSSRSTHLVNKSMVEQKNLLQLARNTRGQFDKH